MTDTAKLFTTGRSQAVRLPMKYRFEGKEVYIHRNPATGDVVLSSGPSSFRVESNSQNRCSSSSPVGMRAGCFLAPPHAHGAAARSTELSVGVGGAVHQRVGPAAAVGG